MNDATNCIASIGEGHGSTVMGFARYMSSNRGEASIPFAFSGHIDQPPPPSLSYVPFFPGWVCLASDHGCHPRRRAARNNNCLSKGDLTSNVVQTSFCIPAL